MLEHSAENREMEVRFFLEARFHSVNDSTTDCDSVSMGLIPIETRRCRPIVGYLAFNQETGEHNPSSSDNEKIIVK